MKSQKECKPHRNNASQQDGENHVHDASLDAGGTQDLNASRLRVIADDFLTLQKARIEIDLRNQALERDRGVSPDATQAERLDESLKTLEEAYRRSFPRELRNQPVYNGFLSKIRGIGPTHSMMLIGILQTMRRFESPSSLWHYSGLHTVDGKAAKAKAGIKSDWNPKMKRLYYLLGESFVRQGGFYRLKYDEWKPQETAKHHAEGTRPTCGQPFCPGCCSAKEKCSVKMHVERRVRRRVVKLFLSHVYAAWRELEGLPTRSPYAIEYLGHKDFIDWHEAVAFDEKEPSVA